VKAECIEKQDGAYIGIDCMATVFTDSDDLRSSQEERNRI
jgi:hypothetical protein